MTKQTERFLRSAMIEDKTISKAQRAAVLTTLKGGADGKRTARTMTRREVCSLLGVSPKTVYNYARAGYLKRVKTTPHGVRACGFTASSVEAVVRNRQRGA